MLLYALSSILLIQLAIGLEESDRCSINAQNGVCLVRANCPEYAQMKQLGVRPRICAYKTDPREPIICCPALASGNDRRNVRRSEQYCDQYRNLASTEILVGPLTPGAELNRHLIPQCDESLGLIVGGQESLPGEFPHMAVLGWSEGRDDRDPEFRCGGSLISERYVLTAGHCVRTTKANVVNVVRLGDHHLYERGDGMREVTLGIETIVVHPEYRPSESRYNDIALVRLNQSVTFGPNIRPACLWPTNQLNETRVVAIGYGDTEDYGSPSSVLMKVGLEVLPNDLCRGLYVEERKLPQAITDSQLCARSPVDEQQRDTCRGDSGGPLQVALAGHRCLYYLVGITSFGKGCGAVGTAGVYTRVAAYLEWIEGIVWP
ncbi:serine protease snake-like [Culex pipiens pallens]|uniref:serine protease snake-like n=1 Tax=Culex pipiens pallens TaxID=42434 RepID=UPI001954D640|nr:serine protease snake-like [Culex pipiens pallens]